jgi:DNA ligase (NAD+)
MKALLKSVVKNLDTAKTMKRADFDALLDYVDGLYYTKGQKPIGDEDYDYLMDIYGERFPKSARLKKVGTKIGLGKDAVPLPYPMSSLSKIKDAIKIKQYAAKYPGPYVVSDKADGMSMELIYRNGVPVEFYTRGDGLEGQDKSHLIPFLRIPKRIPDKAEFAVRAEAVASIKAFESKLSKESGGRFEAVRNAAGGIINTKPSSKNYADVPKTAKLLDVLAFKILAGKGSKLKPSDQFKQLEKYGFDVVRYKKVSVLDHAKLSTMLEQQIKTSHIEIDGLVVEQDAYHRISAANPKHAVSFKENSRASMVEVIVTSVTWNITRTGKIFPQINIKPTKIGGVTVTNFTGHNAFYIQHGYLNDSDEHIARAKPKPIGKGAKLLAVRSGQVIPYVVEVLKAARVASKPDIPFKEKGVDYYTISKSSDTQRQKQIEHFFNAIGVNGIKLRTIQRFWEQGYKTLADFLALDVDDFEDMDGMGKRKAWAYIDDLNKSLENLTFAKVADGSGLFTGFGQERLNKIYAEFPDVLNHKNTRDKVIAVVQGIRGFKELAVAFAASLPSLIAFIDKHKFRIKAPAKQKLVGSKLSKLRVTFTSVRDAQLEADIKANGGSVQSMKSDTNVLVVKDLGASNNKIDKAQDMGIPIYTPQSFRKKYGV